MDNPATIERRLHELDEEASLRAFAGERQQSSTSIMSTSSPQLNNDVEGLKRLIAEKEKDLELAARIGQSLLSKNHILQHSHDELTQMFTVTQDELTQMRHELAMNKELLKFYLHETSDYDLHELDSDTQHPSIKQVLALQRKLRFLEDENHRLRMEAKELSAEAEEFETKETEIIHDCVKELAETKIRLQTMTDNLKRKSEENVTLHDEVAALLSDMVEMQARMNRTVSESDELKSSLDIHRENQNQLAFELIQLQDRFDRLSNYAQDLEEELKELRRKDLLNPSWAELSSTFSAVDSLAAELNFSLHNAYSSAGYSEDEQEDQYKKVMDIVRIVHLQNPTKGVTTSTTVNQSSASITSVSSSTSVSPRKSLISSRGDHEDLDVPLGSYFSGCGADGTVPVVGLDSSSCTDEGICDKSYSGNSSLFSFEGRHCATPDSAVSFGAGSDTSYLHNKHNSAHDFPTRLQLIKPMEGSATLLKWQQLATPTLGGFLESRPGIYTKGQNREADQIIAERVALRKDQEHIPPGIRLDVTRDLPTSSTFTFTTSKRGQDSTSIFSVGALRNETLLPPTVFPHRVPEAYVSTMDLATVLNVRNDRPRVGAATEADPVSADPVVARSRHSSGSLSSASRSPSPPRSQPDVLAPSLVPHSFGNVFRHRSPLLMPVNSLQRIRHPLGKIGYNRNSNGLVPN